MKELEAELLGLHLGDGTLYLINKKYPFWGLRGGLDEKKFYDEHILPLVTTLFGPLFKTKIRSTSKGRFYYGIQTCKKALISFLLDQGLTPGAKVYTTSIPAHIIQGNRNNKNAVVRGLFDTDGCIRFQRKNGGEKDTYPNIEWGVTSKQLAKDIQTLLIGLQFRCKLTKSSEYLKVSLNGHEASRFFNIVQPKNVKHLKRFGFWMKYRYFIPTTSAEVT
jgi:intein/homing endonuclease